MFTNWVRVKSRYNWDWNCFSCKKNFPSKIPYRVRLIDEGHNYKWCENCYQKLMKQLQKYKRS